MSFGGAYAPPQDKNFSLSLRTIGLWKQNSYSPLGQQGLRPQETFLQDSIILPPEKKIDKNKLHSLSFPILHDLLENKNPFLVFLAGRISLPSNRPSFLALPNTKIHFSMKQINGPIPGNPDFSKYPVQATQLMKSLSVINSC